jgi:hypothetical protein
VDDEFGVLVDGDLAAVADRLFLRPEASRVPVGVLASDCPFGASRHHVLSGWHGFLHVEVAGNGVASMATAHPLY